MFAKQFAQYQVRPTLQHLVVHVTNHCNLRCRHCFIDFSPKRDLSLALYRQLAQDVGPVFWVDIGGGEPFLRKDLVDIVAAFQTKMITIPTNGWFVDKTVAQTRALRARLDGELTIALSLDGLQPRHDAIRGEGSWAKVWACYQALRDIDGVNVKINTVLCNENMDDILPLMDHVLAQGLDFHSVLLVRGDTIDPAVDLPSLPELRALQGPLFERLGRYTYGQDRPVRHILRNYHRLLWRTSLQTIERQEQVIPCLAGVSHGVVMGNGDVQACEMLPPVGNLKDARWPALWKGLAMQQQRQSIQRGDCHCTHNCALFDSILFRKRSWPGLLTRVPLGS